MCKIKYLSNNLPLVYFIHRNVIQRNIIHRNKSVFCGSFVFVDRILRF